MSSDQPTLPAQTVDLGTPTESPDLEERRVRALVEKRLLGDVEPGLQIGRFRIIRQLGAGGMGVVYLAEDPELGRKIAVKLLHSTAGGADAQEARARLQREAQAMARVSHVNLATIYDVGRHEGRVFIAMEYIEGQTLREWLKAVPREWRQILDVFDGAGRGLAAAHDAGFVHRDFKPDNVLVGTDGVAKVVDFGLARSVDEAGTIPSEKECDDGDNGADPLLLPQLTQTGLVMGTPAYMAPEQHLGERSDVRADIFAFCVALWEALYGARPFRGDTRLALLKNVLEGPVSRPSMSPEGLPSRVQSVLRAGIAREPARRPESMASLLENLQAARAANPAGKSTDRTWLWLLAVPAGALVFVESLWKQPTGEGNLVLSSVALAGVAAGTASLVAREARRIGVGADRRHPVFALRFHPTSWAIGVGLLWPLFYPLYMLTRRRTSASGRWTAWPGVIVAMALVHSTLGYQLTRRDILVRDSETGRFPDGDWSLSLKRSNRDRFEKRDGVASPPDSQPTTGAQATSGEHRTDLETVQAPAQARARQQMNQIFDGVANAYQSSDSGMCPTDGASAGETGPVPPLSIDCNSGLHARLDGTSESWGVCVPKSDPSLPNEYASSVWSAAGWDAIGFAPTANHAFHFNYKWENDASTRQCVFTVQAFADLDADGLYSTYERRGVAEPDGVNAFELTVVGQDE